MSVEEKPRTDPHAGPALPPEIAFLARHGVPVATLAEAARIALGCGVFADEALLRAGLHGEEAFYRALAAEAGLRFLGQFMVHAMARYPEGVLSGLVPLAQGDTADDPGGYAFAPRGPAVARLVEARERLPARLAIATPTAIRTRLFAARAGPIAAMAADGLPRAYPHLSYRGGINRLQVGTTFAAGLAVGAAVSLAPGEAWIAVSTLLGLAFLGNTALRLAAVLERVPTEPPRPPPRAPDADLPIYTILVALHREARIVGKLVRALSALDYPAPKLDIKLILEDDDPETAAALAELRLPGFVEVIVAPPGAPRTKPRALNVALPLARGRYLAVYDAEDVPDPGQLRLAVSTFGRSEPAIVCLQARLVIDNAADSVITRLFAIEYATLFDVTNPALARFDLPVPLGGTSNHFRTDVLRGLGGWDAWNVTEDADLGIRLAGAGYRVADLPSATYEEAPRHLGTWLRQRTRWMKGFLQVSLCLQKHPCPC